MLIIRTQVVVTDWVDIFDAHGDGCLNLREFKNLMVRLYHELLIQLVVLRIVALRMPYKRTCRKN